MEDLISPKEAASRLGIAISTLYLRMKEPDFPPKIKIGQATRFRSSDMNDYIDENTEQKESNLQPA